MTADPNIIYLEAAAGDIDSFIVTSTMNWSLAIQSGNPWVQTDISNGSNGTKVKLTSIQTNIGISNRQATITITPSGTTSVQPVVVTVVQKSVSPQFSLSTALLTISGIKNDQDSFLVQTNLDWTVGSSEGWLSTNPVSGSNDKKIYINNTEDNLTDNDRTATIIVTPGGTTLVSPKTVTITQKPWYRAHGGIWTDNIAGAAKVGDGSLIFAGSTTSNHDDLADFHGSVDMWLLKTDANGKKLWQKAFGGGDFEYGAAVAVGTDGSYAIAGQTESNNTGQVTNYHGNTDIWVVKSDANGTMQWQKTYGGSGFERPQCILGTSDGGFLISGTTSSGDGDFTGRGDKDLFILKIDAAGNRQWAKFYGGSMSEEGFSIIPSDGGGYMVAGYTSSASGDVTGNIQGVSAAWILKIDANGNLLWQKVIPGLNGTRAKSIIPSGDGGYVVSGFIWRPETDPVSGTNNQNAWLAKISGDGTELWQKNYGGSTSEEATSVTKADDGGFIIAGYAWSNDGDVAGNQGRADIWIVKTDASGNKVWQRTMGGPENDEAVSILPMGNNIYLVSGVSGSDKYLAPTPNHAVTDGLLLKIKD